MRALAWLLALLGALSQAPAALAHASLLRSDPADRAVVALAPSTVTLTFNEPVSPISLKLVGERGHLLDLGPVAAQGETLTVSLPGPLPTGTHLLSWRVMSADGHPVGGSLTFSVGRPGAAAPSSAAEPQRGLMVAIWLARFIIYVALSVGAGGAFYAAFIAGGGLGPGVDRILRAALGAGLVAAVVSLGLQGADIQGGPLGAIARPEVWLDGAVSPYGVTAVLIVVSLVAADWSLGAGARRQRGFALLSLLSLGLALAASGHASAAAPQWLTRPAVFVHAVSLAFWVGALVPLAHALVQGRRAKLAVFSRWIPLPLAALLVSGVVLAAVQLRELSALWTTSYGLVLGAKLAGVAVLLALAALNRRNTGAALAGDRRAERAIVLSVRSELAVVAAVLALVALWRFAPPPRSLLLAAGEPVRVHIHTPRAMADLQIGPAGSAGRQVTAVLLDGEFGPLSAKEVTFVFAKPDRGIEPLRLEAQRVEGSTWQVAGVQIPVAGRWSVQVEILVSDFEKVSVEEEVEIP